MPEHFGPTAQAIEALGIFTLLDCRGTAACYLGTEDSMFSVIIPTADSERALVPTLAALVPGATAGIIREVIVTDAQSRDQTEEVADIAGCRFVSAARPLGVRLNEAAKTARGDWLMFLRPGSVPGPTWIEETIALVDASGRRDRPNAAIFAAETTSVLDIFARAFRRPISPRQGLIVTNAFYLELGGHPDTASPEAAFLKRLGRRRIATLRTPITLTDI
jgi:glycosyltransferase involved in cell wall biosynthesis